MPKSWRCLTKDGQYRRTVIDPCGKLTVRSRIALNRPARLTHSKIIFSAGLASAQLRRRPSDKIVEKLQLCRARAGLLLADRLLESGTPACHVSLDVLLGALLPTWQQRRAFCNLVGQRFVNPPEHRMNAGDKIDGEQLSATDEGEAHLYQYLSHA